MPTFEVRLPMSELDLPLCVSSGQVFRWEQMADGRWLGVDGPCWFLVGIEPGAHEEARYCVETNGATTDLQRLFRLETKLSVVEAAILTLAPELGEHIAKLPGLRVLRPADPEEVLFSFLCTPNNNLERITRMVRALAEFGEPLGTVAGRNVYRFPDALRIAAIPEAELRARGFGYRARSIPNVARQLVEKPERWLAALKEAPYEQAHEALCRIDGIGPKLADCICLFGLHHLEAVPVDTHLWQAARRMYFPDMSGKSLTEARYREIGGFFRGRFGALAGWAHQYLFYENLLRWRTRGRHNVGTA